MANIKSQKKRIRQDKKEILEINQQKLHLNHL